MIGEAGLGWIPYVLQHMDLEWEDQFKDLDLKMKPSEYWHRQFYATYQTDPVGVRLFDLLGIDVRGALAIDLFAGTGALAFEAISRGAERAVVAERHFPTADALKRSARALGLEDLVEVRPGDVLLWVKRMPVLPTTMPWLVFVSPPWSFFSERWGDLGALIEVMMRGAPAGSTIVVEADTSFDAAMLPDAAAWDTRPVPPAVLHFWRVSRA